ncbi:HAD-IA family hydrolase [Kaarinaea lacus]
MVNRYQLLIFDWDGTLIDSEANIVHCMQAASRDLNLPVLSSTEIKNIIGLGLQEALQTLYPETDKGIRLRLVERYRFHFLTSEASQPFIGVDATLATLSKQELFLAVATGKGRSGLNKALQDTGYDDIFHVTRCADETRSKPHPQMLHEILDVLGIEPQQACMIGDTEYDINMAKNAGMDAVAVTYGVHEKERLLQCQPSGCIDTIEELIPWLAQ